MLFDLVIVIIIGLSAKRGWRAGFLNSLSFTAALIISVFFSSVFVDRVFGILEESPLNLAIANALEQNLGFYRVPLFGTTLTASATNITMNVISYFIVFVLIFIVFRILIRLISSTINKIPLVGFANRILGLALGVIKGTILIWILLIFVVLVYDITNSFLAVWFAENNLILYLIVG